MGTEEPAKLLKDIITTCKSFRAEIAERNKASDHLIAAAPELLESLIELSDWMRDHTGPGDGTLEMLVKAVAAIAKAKGLEG